MRRVRDGLGWLLVTSVVALAALPATALAAPSCDPLALADVHSGGSVSAQLQCTGADLNFDPVPLPGHGQAQVDPAGFVTYYPDPDYAGPDGFDVEVSDNEGGSTTAVVTVDVVNAAPTCSAIAETTGRNSQAYLMPECADADDDALTFTVGTPGHGTAEVDVFGGITYTPDDGFTGTDTFTYRAHDAVTQSAPATATVTVTNTAPICNAFDDDHVSLRTGKPLKLTVYCDDAEGDPLTVTASQAPAHGTLGAVTTDDGFSYRVTYTPAAGYTGPDSLALRASDGTLSSDPAAIDLTITPNHAPTCEDQLNQAKVATTLRIYLFCDDQDAQDQEDGLAYSAVAGSGPAHGTLSFGVDSGFDYVEFTPAAGYTGTDAFTLRASDGSLSDTALMRLHIANTPFCATPAPISVRSGRSLTTTIDCTQPPGDFTALNLVITSPPTRGTLFGSGLFRSYTANAGADGADSFAYKATSGAGESPVVTQAITVGPTVNHPPVCDASGFRDTVYAARPRQLLIFCEDADADAVTLGTRGQPAHGTSSASNGRITYVGNAGYVGDDDVPFTANDGHGATVDGSWPVTVAPPEAPTCNASPIAATVRPGRSVSLPLFCSNPQGDPQTFSAPTPPSKGTLGSFDSFGNVYYTAANGPDGTDTFTLRAADAAGNSAPVSVTITIDQSFNRAPSCFASFGAPRKVARNVATSLDFTTVCSDPDDDPLTFTRVTQPQSGGTVSAGPAATLTYTPPAGFTGADQFTFHATDSRGVDSTTVTFYLDVVESLAPTCSPPAALSLRPGQSRSVFANCTSPAGGPLTYKITSAPAIGTLSPSGDSSSASRTYTAPGAEGDGSYQFRVSGPGGESVSYTQTITVANSANQLPSCQPNDGFPQRVVAARATTLTIAARCFDADNDPLTFTRTLPDPQHGTATASAGGITYTSAAGYTGTDHIGYIASDGHGGSVSQTFTVDVGPAIAPTCEAPQTVAVRPNRTIELDFDCQDAIDSPITYDIVTPPSLGTLDPAGDGPEPSRAYHAGAAPGTDTFTYRATSENGNSNTVTQTITVSSTANTDPECFSNSGFPAKAATERPRTLDPFCSDAEDDALHYTKLTNPSHGTVSDAGGTLVYTSAAGYTGPDQFTYSAADALGGTSAPTTFFVNVVAVQAPSCPAHAGISVRPGRSRSLDLTCTDALGDQLTYVIDGQPTKGTLSAGSGALRFYTAGAATGSDAFTWHAHSPTMGDSAGQTQTITISAAANLDPTCPSTFNATAKPGQQRSITPTCTDADADPIHFAKQSEPAHGTLTSADGVLRYTATAGYTGPDSFTYRATDDFGGQSAVSTVAVTVSNANAAPTCAAGPFAYSVTSGTQLTLPAAPCSDSDGDTLTIETPTLPAHGTLTVNPDGTGTYTPNAGYTGPDSFTFRAFDGTARSAIGTVNLTVTAPANQAPVCQPVAKKVAPGVTTTVNLSCSDPNGDPITLEKVAGPSHGALGAIDQGTDSVVYTPNALYTGPDSFTYRASDATSTGSTATVTLDVTHAPACDAVARTTAAGAPVSVPLTCTDADGDALTLSIVSPPSHGTLGAIAAGAVTYTPAAGYNGPDAFTYRASDGTAQSAPATASLTVTRAPACDAVTRKTAVDAAVSVPLSCTDADGDALTLSIVSPPSHGTLGAITAGAVTYTPAAGYFGADSFTYRASDGTAQSPAATVSLTVTRAPTCAPVSASTPSGTAVEVTLSCTDADGDALTLSKVSDPAHGALGAIAAGKVTYTPAGTFKGADSFTYRASDGTAQSAPATVSLTVTNRAPACDAKTVSTPSGAAVEVTLSCADPESDPLTLTKVADPAHGTLGAIAGGKVTYTPAAGYRGADSFTYDADDGSALSTPATVSITVTNRAPVCDAVAASTPSGSPVEVTLACSDPEGDVPVTLSKASDPAHGTVGAIAGGKITYTPAAGFKGADSFTYRAADATAQGAPATVSLTVTNRGPSCSDVSASTPGGTPGQVTLACTDPEGDALTLSKVTDPAHGTLGAFAAGKVTYTPDAGYKGADSFTYRASDGTAQSAPATAAITVTNSVPACAAKSTETAFETAVEVPLSCTDADGDALTLSIVAAPAHGAIGSISGGKVTYTPGAGYSGADSFTYRATDGTAQSAPATVSLTVKPKPVDPGNGNGGGTPPPPPPPPPVDTKAPSASVALAKKQKLAAVLSKGLGLAVTLDEAGTVTLKLTVDKATARKLKLGTKAVVVGTLTKALSAGKTTVTVKLTAKARKALKKAKSVKLGVLVSAKDAAGNAGSRTSSVTLKR